MAEIIRLPRMSDTMSEGKIVNWHKKVGDKVKSGDVLAEIETDKAVMELESYSTGVLLYIANEKGSLVAVDAVLAVIGKEGEDYKHVLGGGDVVKPVVVEGVKSVKSDVVSEVKGGGDVDVASLGVTLIRMPLLSDTMKEGKIVKWNKKIGDKVKSDDNLADVETDKATMEVVGYVAGTLLYVGVKEGENALVNSVIAIIGKEGTNVDGLVAKLGSMGGGEVKKEVEEVKDGVKEPVVVERGVGGGVRDRVKASPLARRIAMEKGIDIGAIKGSGDGGRIVRSDVMSYHGVKSVVGEVGGGQQYEDVPLSQMRKTIAKRLSESKFSAPHFYLTMSVDMDNAMANRQKLNGLSKEKISFNDMVIKAAAMALKKHPHINSSWLGDRIRLNHVVNVGVAVAIPDGLLVPVVRQADVKSLSTISQEVKLLSQKAKDKQLQPKDWEGSTFTISNLGMFGVDEFTAIINPPDACILAVGGIQQQAVVKNGQVVVGNVMKLTLSCDHRVVDGAMGAAFLQTLKQYLEEPIFMLL